MFLDLLLGLLALLRVDLRISCTRTRVWLLVWACDLRDVVDNVYVVIDRLVRHCFVALVARGRQVCIVEAINVGWFGCISCDLGRIGG